MAKEEAINLGKCQHCDAIAEWKDIQDDIIVNVCRKHVKAKVFI